MGPSAFGQIKGADFENRCYTGILGPLASFSCLNSRFCVFEGDQRENSLNGNK